MAIYTRKKGQYQQLTREQVRRLRRVNEVNDLMDASRSAALTLRGFSMWLATVEKAKNKASPMELDLVLPHRVKFLELANKIDETSKKIRGM